MILTILTPDAEGSAEQERVCVFGAFWLPYIGIKIE